jgi:predicted amidohydrolase
VPGTVAALTVAVAQSLATPGELARALDRHTVLATLAADAGAALVVFPELSLTGYHRHLRPDDALSPEDPRLQELQDLADQRDLVIAVGAPLRSAAGLHIGTICLVPRRPALTYFKQHLHEGEEVAFTAGREAGALVLGSETVGLAICADIGRREHAQQAAAGGATLYAASCLLTEDGYDGDATVLRGYARTHHMAVLMANYGGPSDRWSSAGQSAIWSESGILAAAAPTRGEAVVVASRGERWSGRVLQPTVG